MWYVREANAASCRPRGLLSQNSAVAGFCVRLYVAPTMKPEAEDNRDEVVKNFGARSLRSMERRDLIITYASYLRGSELVVPSGSGRRLFVTRRAYIGQDADMLLKDDEV